MSGRRSKILRKAAMALAPAGEYRSKDDAIRQPILKRLSFKNAMRFLRKTLIGDSEKDVKVSVTGQIIHTRKLSYRRAKKAWSGHQAQETGWTPRPLLRKEPALV